MIRRLIFLIPAGVALLAGLDAGLLLLGLPAPVTTERLPDAHGMVMVLGFVGTVIALERAVALRRGAGFAAAPALLGVGGLLVTSSAPLRLGQMAFAAGAAALVAVYVPLWHRQRDDSILIQAFGAVLATGGRCCGSVAYRSPISCPGWRVSWCSPSPVSGLSTRE